MAKIQLCVGAFFYVCEKNAAWYAVTRLRLKRLFYY